jgi:hypothetical protein
MSEYYYKTQPYSTNVRVYNVKQRVKTLLFGLLWHLAPEWTGRLIRRYFFTPIRNHATAQEAACLVQGEPFQIQVHDKIIQAWKWGRGPGVLLVHGWNGYGAQFYRFITQLVDAGYSAIAFDGPAHGASTGHLTSYFEFTDVVRAFLARSVEWNLHAIIGHSFGAAAAINSLAKDRLGLTAVCIAPILRLQELIFRTFVRFGVPLRIADLIIGDFEKRYGYSLRRDNPYSLLGEIGRPVLIVHDVDDRAAPFDDSHEISMMNKHIALHPTQGLGHKRVLSDALVIATCLDYLGRRNVLPETSPAD